MHPVSLLVYATRGARRLLSLNVFAVKPGRKTSRRISPQAYLQRDVHSKRFQNPYQRQPRFVRLRDWFVTYRFRLSSIALGILLISWAYILFLSPHFYVRAVHVSGTQEIPNADVVRLIEDHFDGRAWLIFPRSHFFFMQTKDLEQKIRSKYHLSTLTFERFWSSQRFELRLEEKPSVFAYSVDSRFFSLDREGIVIRELPAQPENAAVPVIYQYDSTAQPTIGQAVLNAQAIQAIEQLSVGLQAYPNVHVHSFRIRISPQREIKIVEKVPESEESSSTSKPSTGNPELAQAAELIAQAQTAEDRIESLKKALQEISLEKLEEDTIDQLLKDERVYTPDANYQYQELEVYMAQGWSLKAGHTVLENAADAQRILSIFATLNQQLNLEREVKEYIDLRFGNRVYYR